MKDSTNQVRHRQKVEARVENIRGALQRHGPLCVRAIQLSSKEHKLGSLWIVGHLQPERLDIEVMQATYENWARSVASGTDISIFFEEHLSRNGYIVFDIPVGQPVGTLQLK